MVIFSLNLVSFTPLVLPLERLVTFIRGAADLGARVLIVFWVNFILGNMKLTMSHTQLVNYFI